MIIVAGALRVDADQRDDYLAACREAIVAARVAPGCVDFHLAADPLEADRINVFEQWESVEAVEAFRGSGPPDDLSSAIRGAHVVQHEIATSTDL